MSYKIQRELEQLPEIIEDLESKHEALQKETGTADFYQKDHTLVTERLAALQQCEAELEEKMERWLTLEALKEGS